VTTLLKQIFFDFIMILLTLVLKMVLKIQELYLQ